LLLEAAWANGYTGRNFRDHRAVLRFAFGRGIEASFSTIDIVRLDDGDYEAHVLITSNVPDADRYYPGEVQRYDVATQTWISLFPCKVSDIN
jgi:hypothetical protein